MVAPLLIQRAQQANKRIVLPERQENGRAFLEFEGLRRASIAEQGIQEMRQSNSKSGRRIVELLRSKKGDLTDDDVEHMAKVVGYGLKVEGQQLWFWFEAPITVLGFTALSVESSTKPIPRKKASSVP